MTFGGLDALFNPSKQLMDEEKLRLQSTREEIGDSSGGKRIDLDSGRVRLGRPADDDDDNLDGSPGSPGSHDGEQDGAAPDDADRERAVTGNALERGEDRHAAVKDGEAGDTTPVGTAARKASAGKAESAAVQRARARRRKPSSS